MNAAGHRSVVYLHGRRKARKSLYTRADDVVERIKRSWLGTWGALQTSDYEE